MRWQRIARLAIAVVVLVFTAVVAVKLLRPTKPRVPAQATPQGDPKSVAEVGPLTYTSTDDNGKTNYTINAKRSLTYPDGRQLLEDGDIILPSQRPHDEGAWRLHGAGHASGRRAETADRARHQGRQAHLGRRPRSDQRPGELRQPHCRGDHPRRRAVHQGTADGIGEWADRPRRIATCCGCSIRRRTSSRMRPAPGPRKPPPRVWAWRATSISSVSSRRPHRGGGPDARVTKSSCSCCPTTRRCRAWRCAATADHRFGARLAQIR